MPKYIDADAAQNAIRALYALAKTEREGNLLAYARQNVRDLPAADVEPVRHGIMTKENEAACKQIADHYGWNHQREKAIEECGELIVALEKFGGAWAGVWCHERLNSPQRDAVIEELADVMIMCQQAAYLLGAEDEAGENIKRKLDRQQERMKAEYQA